MSRTKADILSKVTKPVLSSKIVANNTLEIQYEDGTQAIRLHDTNIIIYDHKDMILNSGGWRTKTTKDRINDYIDYAFTIIQRKSQWYLFNKDKQEIESVFYDGITIDTIHHIIKKPMKEDKTTSKYIKLIDTYCKKLSSNIDTKKDYLKNLVNNIGGDCLYCCNKEIKTGLPLGDITNNKEHLISHLQQKYFMGSLILNALADRGYKDPMFIIQIGAKESIIRAIKQYFKKRLGIA